MARLLIVDDEADILDLMVRQASAAGHQVLAAATGAAAHDLIEEQGLPDGVLLDVDLPVTDGFTLLEQLRQRRPQLPAVFVTVLWSSEVIEQVRQSGCPMLGKPFSLRDLDAAIASLSAAAHTGDLG